MRQQDEMFRESWWFAIEQYEDDLPNNKTSGNDVLHCEKTNLYYHLLEPHVEDGEDHLLANCEIYRERIVLILLEGKYHPDSTSPYSVLEKFTIKKIVPLHEDIH